MEIIWWDEVDVMILGGIYSMIYLFGVIGFNFLMVFFMWNDEFMWVLCFFDWMCDGFVLGEGVGMLIFEELEYVKECGVIIYGEIFGYGLMVDVYWIIDIYLDGCGVVVCMNMVLVDV